MRQGVHQAEVARRVGAHRQSVGRWAQQLEEGDAALKWPDGQDAKRVCAQKTCGASNAA